MCDVIETDITTKKIHGVGREKIDVEASINL
jgi:hypothetical protein